MTTNHNNTERLLDWLEDRLAPADRARLDAELAQSPALQAELDALRRTRDLLQASADDVELKPFFTDRLMKRLEPAAKQTGFSLEEEFALILSQWFRPVALVGLLLVVALAAYNINLSSDYQGEFSVAESVLALPPVSSEIVYDLDTYTP